MKALRKSGGRVAWEATARTGIVEPKDVEVEVQVAGVCRTDLYAARGRIATAEPVVLGHEFAGEVIAVGAEVSKFRPGDHVTAAPLLGPIEKPRMVGVDLDGGFGEYVTLPEELFYKVPVDLSWRRAAYVEPVAASLAVVSAPIGPAQEGVILGSGRIGELTLRVLLARGFEKVRVLTLEEARALPRGSLDFVIETWASEEAFAEIFRVLRPGGVLVLKSRPEGAVPLDVLTVVRKELRIVGAHYGPFPEAIELLATGLAVDDLLGPTHDPASFAEVFSMLEADESRKHFFAFREGHRR